MELTIITRMGDEELRLKGISLKEMLQVCTWTGYKNKTEWIQAFNDEEPLAVQAGYALAVWRASGEKPSLASLDFDMDTMDSRMVDETGETIMLSFEQNKDGSLKLGSDKKPIVKLGEDGRPQFFYAVSGEPVPTEAAPSIT